MIGIIAPLLLIFFIPLASWLEARQTVYVITDHRAFILVTGASKTVTSFVPAELKGVSRRVNNDWSSDVIVYIHRTKDYDGDIQTQEIGFKQIRDPKAFEQRLRRLT